MATRGQEGVVLIVGPDGTTERDTVQCRHCQHIVECKPGSNGTVYLIPTDDLRLYVEEAGAWCQGCFGPLCLRCVRADGSCAHGEAHWERRMTAFEVAMARSGARGALLQAVLGDQP